MNRVKALTYSQASAWLFHWPAVTLGALIFKMTGHTPWVSYWSMRRLYCISHGRSNRRLGRWLARRPHNSSGTAGADRTNTRTLAELRQDGLARLNLSLSRKDCASLRELASSTPCRTVPPVPGSPFLVPDPGNPKAVKYDVPEAVIVTHPVVRRLIADPGLRRMAQDYLGCEPINDLVAMWWSFPGPASSEAAQLYHFDMDRPQFLKVFCYLTDVQQTNGPHCYVRGSHSERPQQLWQDGRQSDEAILDAYGRDREVTVTGPEGSMFAVDTSGLHKGKPLTEGVRLVLQIEFTSALFGTDYARVTVPADEFWRQELARDPYYYSRFQLAE